MNATTQTVPAHVPASRVFFFDYHHDQSMRGDVHGTVTKLQRELPSIFYSPANGGHWVITRFDLLEQVIKDTGNFSSVQTQLPLLPVPKIEIPLHLDPPAHTPFRVLLMRYFSSAAVKEWTGLIRATAEELVGSVRPAGACDFAAEIGTPFPISIFGRIMGLPPERLEDLRGLVVSFASGAHDIEKTLQTIDAIEQVVRELIVSRRREPRNDLISHLIAEKVEGRAMSEHELESVCFQLLIAGLDTVASTAAYVFRHLAEAPALQAELSQRPDRIPDFLEESMRMYGVVNTVRTAKCDVQVGDVLVRAGEAILCMLPAAGRDDRRNPEPDSFRLDRQSRQHMLFGGGVHLCLGHFLARIELRILVEEWLRNIPSFRLQSNFTPEYRLGGMTALLSLPLEWTP